MTVLTAIRGPHGVQVRPFAIDTGASFTTCDPALLLTVGVVPSDVVETRSIAVVGGTRDTPLYRVTEVSALGVSASGLPVAGIVMPRRLGIYGLLGLDFLRDRRLTIDFRAGTVELD
ncbi:MAG: aspartyl protease family protein [Dehalococcoidia bacterium]